MSKIQTVIARNDNKLGVKIPTDSSSLQCNQYTKGLDYEQLIIDALGLVPSTVDDNKHNDVDAYTRGRKYGVSIKTQFIAVKTGNLAIELQVKTKNGEWLDSWGINSKADVTLFHVPGRNTYLIHREQKQKLLSLPITCPNITIKTLSNQVKQSQKEINHYHTDSRLLVVSIDWLLDNGLLVEKPKFYNLIEKR